MGNLNNKQETGFSIDASPTRFLPYKNRMHNAITYEISTTRYSVSRHVYNIFNFLGELGGLLGAFGSLGTILVTILHYRGSYMFVMSDMLLPS